MEGVLGKRRRGAAGGEVLKGGVPSLRWIALLDVWWEHEHVRDGVRVYVVTSVYVTTALVRQWMTRSSQTAPNPHPPPGSFLGHGPSTSANFDARGQWQSFFFLSSVSLGLVP